jgi:nucleotide-binding universal stress UspA family protein
LLKTILVPLDGSPLSEQAIPFARALAHGEGAKVLLLRAVPKRKPFTPGDHLDEAADARAQLESVAEMVREAVIDAETCIREDEPGLAITEAARERQAQLIVMSTHGRTGLSRAMYGSVADHVLRNASAPLLLVRPDTRFNWGQPFRVVVGLDGSRLAEEAIGPALDVAEALRGELALVQAVEPPAALSTGYPTPFAAEDLTGAVDDARRYLDAVAKRIARAGVRVSGSAGIGSADAMIFDAVRTYRAGAIALATHGRGGLKRLLLGSVAARILSETPVPLLVVRPPAMRQQHTHIPRDRAIEGAMRD